MDSASPQVWQEFKSGLVQTAVYKRWRIKANGQAKEIFIDPTPTASQCDFEWRDGAKVKIGIAYEYISNQWAQSATNVAKSDFTVDTDTFILSDDLLELSIKWRFLSVLGQTYIEEKHEFDRALGVAKAQDGGAANIMMDSGTSFRYPNIPETGVGL